VSAHTQTHGPFIDVASLTWGILENKKCENVQSDQSVKIFTLKNFPLYSMEWIMEWTIEWTMEFLKYI